MIDITQDPKYVDNLMYEMELSDDMTFYNIVKNDIVKAYWYGFVLDPFMNKLTTYGIKSDPVDQTVEFFNFAIKKYQRQIEFWINDATSKEIKDGANHVLNNIVIIDWEKGVDSSKDLLNIAFILGYRTFIELKEKHKDKNKELIEE